MTQKSSKRRKANHGAGAAEHPREREMSAALISSLNHPIRRHILRLLSKPGTELSPSKMTRALVVGLPILGFHARVLCEREVVRETGTQQVRGATEHFYASNVSRNRLVEAILKLTEEDDSLLRK